MNITKLIEELTEARTTYGDLEVSVWADHGQSNTIASCVSIMHRDKDGECCAEEDLNEYEPEDHTAVIEIS